MKCFVRGIVHKKLKSTRLLTHFHWLNHTSHYQFYLLSFFAAYATDEAAQYGHHLLLLLISFFLHWFLNITSEVRRDSETFLVFASSWSHSPSTDKTCVLSWIRKNEPNNHQQHREKTPTEIKIYKTPTSPTKAHTMWNEERKKHKKFRFFLTLQRLLKSLFFHSARKWPISLHRRF